MEAFNHLKVPLEIIMQATKNFDAGNFIAEGGYGKVYRGEFFHSEGQIVGAVKLMDRSKDQADASFYREIMLLSTYRHENLISLLGFCDEGRERILVYDYASNKSLDFHLHSSSLTWIQRLKICLGAACGLQYLHDPKGTQQRVLHRDIKSANILLDQDWNAKIADFGLSKYGPANQAHTFLISDAKGTPGYCDPMYVETMLLTKESDVYSFGVVLFEVLCSRPCVDWSYEDERRSLPILVKKCNKEQRLHTIIDVNLRQQIDQNCFETFVLLAKQCLERERTQRPTMESVVKMLKIALDYQEIFEVKEAERRNRLSRKQVVFNFKSQDQQKRNSVLQKVANYEVNLHEGKGRNRYLKDIEEDSVKQQERESSLKNKEIQNPLSDYQNICPPGGSNSVILYTTSFKTIPKTFNDCLSILSVLKSFKVLYEERDLSMHSSFRDELVQIFGRNVAPPKLFIKGRYIGGAEEVLWLHEQGKFRPLLAGIPQNTSKGLCKGCDGYRFVICGHCNGSRMVDFEDCRECNENGLVKCPICH